MATTGYIDLPIEGSVSGVTSLNSETGDLTLVAGSNITITPSGSNITIASTGGGSGTVTSLSLLPSSVGAVTSPTTTPLLTLNQANASTNGYLSQTDWNTFNNKPSTSFVNSQIPALASSLATKKIIYVSQDVGVDTNDGSLLAPFKTIQAGINAANLIAANYAQVIVLVSPGAGNNGYLENITLSQQGVILQAQSSLYRSDSCIIRGSVTINLTGTSGGVNFIAASNIVYIHGFTISNSASDAIIFSGSTFQRLFLSDSYVQSTSGSALNMTNTGVSSGTNSTIVSRDTDFENNALSVATITVGAGRLFLSGSAPSIQNNNTSGPALNVTGASLAGPNVTINEAAINGQVIISDNTANVTLSFYSIVSGSLPGIVTPSSPNTGVITIGTGAITTSATNSITGSGILVPGGENAKTGTGGDIISTVTQITLPKFPEGQTLLGAGATAVANSLLVIKDGHITSLRTTAPTVAAANAGSGASASVANATDVAGKVTLVTGTGTITTTATLTLTFNKAYAVAPIIQLTPSNSAAGINAVQKYCTATTTTFVINFAVAPSVSTTYSWFYHVIETQ